MTVTLDEETAAQLDDPPLAALTGPHSVFADVLGNARRYQTDVAVFGGCSRDDRGWRDLAELLGPGGLTGLFMGERDVVPAGLSELARYPCHQMVAAVRFDRASLPIVELGSDDVPDMLELTRLTDPGPFFERTHQLGRYTAVRADDGRILAMAGERMHLGNAVEISAVCTHPDSRGRGLGAALTTEIAAGIQDRGLVAALHVQTPNQTARSLYERLGFEVRRDIDVVVLTPAP